jgi:hypothetical protein
MSESLELIREACLSVVRERALVLAQNAAKELVGLVITSPEQASLAVDRTKVVKQGTTYAKTAVKMLKAKYVEPREEEIEAAFKPIIETLKVAEEAGKDALLSYNLAEQRRIAAEKAARERAAAEAAKDMVGDSLAPPPEEVVSEAPAKLRGARGAAEVKNKPWSCEVYDWAEVPNEWKELRAVEARREFSTDVPKGGVVTLPDGSYVWRGVRFWREQTVAIR